VSQDISSETEREEKDSSSFPWIEEFRNSIQAFDQKHADSFAVWFGDQQSRNELKDPFHCLLTLLVHARFDQRNDTEKAIENTQRVFRLLAKPEIALDEVPVLEGTLFFSGEQWRDLFYRAISKLQQVSHGILEKRTWEAFEIERLTRVIPHMSERLSRKAVRWISQLIPESVQVDFSNHPVWIDANLYRVASRLGIIDPHFDFYQGKTSMGDLKLQTFAKVAFPQDPSKIEMAMVWIGRNEAGGYCFSLHPRCEECLFETFCPKLYLDFDPAEKGMGRL
jgi:endonuclease III